MRRRQWQLVRWDNSSLQGANHSSQLQQQHKQRLQLQQQHARLGAAQVRGAELHAQGANRGKICAFAVCLACLAVAAGSNLQYSQGHAAASPSLCSYEASAHSRLRPQDLERPPLHCGLHSWVARVRVEINNPFISTVIVQQGLTVFHHCSCSSPWLQTLQRLCSSAARAPARSSLEGVSKRRPA